MSFLKTVSDHAGDLIIKEMLHSRLGGPEKARSQQHIHSSDLTKEDPLYCPREVRLRQLLGKRRRDQFLQVATHVTFDEGRDKQWRLNNDWLRDAMWGHWACPHCGFSIDDLDDVVVPAPDGCRKCGGFMEYSEPRVLDSVTGVGGGLDALVDVGESKLRLVECKIMKGDQFKSLLAPLSEHRVRTRLYLRLLAGSEQPFSKQVNLDFANVLYIMRGHGIKQSDGRISPFKEFIVQRDDTEIEHFLGMAHALQWSRGHEGFYPAGICSTQMCSRARKCSVAKECFSAQYPGNITWLKNGAPVHAGENILRITNGDTMNECTGE